MSGFLPEPEVEPDRLAAAANGPASFRQAMDASSNQLTGMIADFVGAKSKAVNFISPEEAQARFGAPGLTFDTYVNEGDAAARQAAAQRRAFQSDTLSRTSPLTALGASLAGGLIDPAGLPLMFAPELLGVRGAVEGAMAARATSGVLAKAGRLGGTARGAVVGGVEGVAGGVAYESVNLGLRRYLGDDDYDLGDSLTNVLIGAVFGGGLGGTVGALGGFRAPPRALAELPEEARLGGAVSAIDALVDERPVHITPLIEAERPPPATLGALDEASGAGELRQARLRDDVAVTTRGTEIPVRYAVVELDDLVTSHGDDLERNPAFPEALQPRDRTRAGSQAGNYRLEAELNPKRLMFEAGAETGAPLVSPEGIVESGNGRTIALRRSARTGSGAYERYRAELAAQGVDATGFARPVLVRVRTQPMTGETRAALAREMNAAPTETFGAAEQAMVDAKALDEAALAHLDGTPEGQRRFAKAFIAKAAPDQQNALADAQGALSATGQARIKAALVARAYDDPRLVEALFEQADPNIKAIGAALAEAAPRWARMRALAARGEIPAELDMTAQLREAVDLVRHARDHKIPVHELIADRLDQVDMFSGQAMAPETEAFLRLMFADEGFRRPRSASKLGWALDDYARQASEVTPGPNLFGETPDGDGKLILDGLARKFAQDEPFPQPGDLESLAAQRAEPARVDVRPDAGGGPGGDLQPKGGEHAAPAVAPKADPFAGVDPELRALAEADAADAPGLEPRQDPATIAEAIRAAAFCLKEG